jgi:hypothetical protein
MKYKYTYTAFDFDLNSWQFTRTYDEDLNDIETQKELSAILNVNRGLANVIVSKVEKVIS